jgi:hypothetical protein
VIHVDIVEVIVTYAALLEFQVIGWVRYLISTSRFVGISDGVSFGPLCLLQLHIITDAFAVVFQIVIEPTLLRPVRVSMTVVSGPGHHCGLQAAQRAITDIVSVLVPTSGAPVSTWKE